MSDIILTSIFKDRQLWQEAIEHGVGKVIRQKVLGQFQDPHFRAQMCREVAYGNYVIQPPHTGYRTKDDGGERVFFINEPQDRLLLFLIYKWLIRNERGMIHPSCLSYQEGIGIGMIVKKLSERLASVARQCDGPTIIGRKFDIHKYFDSVDRRCIHHALDMVEEHHGKSSVIDLLRRYYDSDTYYDSRLHEMLEAYNGIKQGSAVSAWLANVILYPVDEALSALSGLYLRYSDDIIYIGEDYEEATIVLRRLLSEMGLELNEKKIEDVWNDRFIRFLGYNLRGNEITLSQKWVKHFQKEIEHRTIRHHQFIRLRRDIIRKGGDNQDKALRRLLSKAEKAVVSYLYYGDGQFSWASHVMGIVNRHEDIMQLNLYCLDALRAVYTGKGKIGGLGFSMEKGIVRGRGRNVSSNLKATMHIIGRNEQEGWLDNFYSITGMQKLYSNKWLCRTIVAGLLKKYGNAEYPNSGADVGNSSLIDELETIYNEYLNSKPDGRRFERYYAKTIDELTSLDMLVGENRQDVRKRLEDWISDNLNYENHLQKCPNQWFWQSETHPELVLLKEWFEG